MYNSNELYHFGVKGMKRGIRRDQKKDGSLTKITKDYGEFDSSKQIEFKPMFKD